MQIRSRGKTTIVGCRGVGPCAMSAVDRYVSIVDTRGVAGFLKLSTTVHLSFVSQGLTQLTGSALVPIPRAFIVLT